MTETPAPAPNLLAHRRASGLLFLLLVVVMWLSFLEFPTYVAADELDGSWAQAYGYFLKHRMQAGTDYLFTFGPLGYFTTNVYDADLFWYKYAWELLLKLVFALLLAQMAWRLPGWPERVGFCVLAVVFLPVHGDPLYLFTLLVLGLFLLSDAGTSWPRLTGGVALLALLALVKFTFLLVALGILGCLSLALIGRRRLLVAVAPWLLFTLFFAAAWVLLGQRLTHLPNFLRGSLEVTTGYVEAMSVEGAAWEWILALIILALLGTALIPSSGRAWRDGRFIAATILLGLCLFLQWKHGFTRQPTHTGHFFAFTLLVPFLLPVFFPACNWQTRPRFLLLFACVLLSLIGHWRHTLERFPTEALKFRERVAGAVAPWRLQATLEQQKAERTTTWSLPAVTAEIRDAPVDLLSHEQGIVLLNPWNWRPRPVFQSYSAYTPFLLSTNACFFRGENAPAYVLLKLRSFDGRPPSFDDGPALIEILQRYEPVLEERSFLLMKRRGEAGSRASSPPRTVLERTITFGEEVVLDDSGDACQVLALRMKYSPQGELRKLLYKPPPVFLRLRLADGRTLTHRIIPAMAEAGFLLNPLLEENQDVIDLYNSAAGKRVLGFCVVVENDAQWAYEKEVQITITNLHKRP